MMSDVDIAELLHRIGLRVSREAIHALIAHATKSKLGPSQLLEQLAAIERRDRDTRNLASRVAAACVGTPKPLDQFDWNYPAAIDRALFEHHYQTLEFLEQGENILFRGPSGAGKTTLARHYGLRALERGYSVRFITLSTALADLLSQESLPATERRLKRYTAPRLLILDELGYLPCDARAADMLFHIVSRRHEHRSIIITTNLAYKQWPGMFPGASCLSALIDRFAQHCHTIDIEADSWRNHEAQQRAKGKPPPKPPRKTTKT
jgi:DNA replication protein DnaC